MRLERARRRSAGIRHENIHMTKPIARMLPHARDPFVGRDISGNRVDVDTRSLRDRVACLLEGFGPTRADHERSTFGGERLRDRAAQPAACRGDERRLAAESEIHTWRA